MLGIDEPTNHVDADTRRLLLAGLESFQGIGLLVSHDRELLDRLCARCLILETPRIALRPANHTATMELDRAEKSRRRGEYERARESALALRKKVSGMRREAAGARARLSKRRIDPKDHDAKTRIDLALPLTRKWPLGKLTRPPAARTPRT